MSLTNRGIDMTTSTTTRERRAARGVLTGVVAAVSVVGLAIPAAAGPGAAERIASAAEREAWTLQERAEHGEELWGEDAAAGADPVEAHQQSPTALPDAPSIIDGGVTTEDARTASDDAVIDPLDTVTPGEVTLEPRAGKAASGKAGDVAITVDLSTANGKTKPSTADDAEPSGAVKARVSDRAAAERAGIAGLLLTVENADDNIPAGQVDISVDLDGLDLDPEWVSRARLVEMPACAITTPEGADCRQQTEIADQDRSGTSLIAEVEVGDGDSAERPSTGGSRSPRAAESATARQVESATTVLAVTADTSGDQGDWSATPLDPSATWDVTGNTGSFTWSYPMRTPATPGGLDPEVSLSYDSGSLDGKVASANSQAGAIGDGWDLSAGGYIERSYVPCAQDQASVGGNAPNNASRDTGDLCWKSDNATLVLGGKGGELVRDGTSNTYRLKDDDNTKVERLTGGWNGDNDKEYWKVTTSDGTQYWFGRDQRSATDTRALYSGWTVPVYGNHPGEPCYDSSYASSRCLQAWRWNLDYVVDPLGNSMTYIWTREWNRYGYNNNAGTERYVRGGFLRRIEYGTRAGTEAEVVAPARVEFLPSERCLTTETFDCAASKIGANPGRWPDVPEDLICDDTSSCAQVQSPAFFSRKRTTQVVTQIRTGASSYKSVDRWTMTHGFPDPGGETGKQLWLRDIDHDGLSAEADADDVTNLPKVVFTGSVAPNRVNEQLDGRPAMNRYRLVQIRSESGGATNISYSTPDCTASDRPVSPWTNTRRCMPVYWTPAGSYDEPILEYFHKYVVTGIVEDARIPGSRDKLTTYDYVGDAAWHYDDNELVRPKQRTWGQWRGYATVDVRLGESGLSEAPQIRTRTRYFRGMHGDRLNADGGTRSEQVDGINDHDEFAGREREVISYDGSDVVEREKTTPWRSAATATNSRGNKAYHTAVATSETVTTAPALSGGVRTVVTDTEYDGYGMPIKVTERGDTAISGDERCTETTYVRNTSKNILNLVRRTETVSKRCDQTASRPADVIADERFAYDGGHVGDQPTEGLETLRQEVKAYSSGSPQYVDVTRTTYDSFGRPTADTDALNRTTTTAYTQTNGLTTQTKVTTPDPDGSGSLTAHVTTTDLDPAFGVPVKVTDPNGNATTGKYDGLGRLVRVWEPGRVQGTDTASTRYTYSVRDTGQNGVRTQTLNHDASAYLSSTVILDGLLRERQTQSPSADRDNPGRVVTDTLYDPRGLAHITYDNWFTTGDPVTTVVYPATGDGDEEFKFNVPSSTVTRYDSAGRATDVIERSGGQERWRTTTEYHGDRTLTDPPTGGTPTMEITDARGNTTELRQYLGSSPSGSFQATTYAYDGADRLVGVTDPAGNDWTYTYDLRGRQIGASDPDKGTTTSTYDAVGQVTTSTDARGEKLAHTYDALGRKIATRDDSASGALRSAWQYDTLAKGQLTSATRHSGSVALTTAVTGYDHHYRPLGEKVTVPSNSTLPAGLTGEFEIEHTYTATGLPDTKYFPPAGGLPGEVVRLSYDSANQPRAMVGGAQGGAYVAESEYSEYGQLLFADLGGNYSVGARWTYDTYTRRLTEQSVTREGAGGNDYVATYRYDAAGNVLGIDNRPTVSGLQRDAQCFTYDGLRRLTHAWTPGNGDCATANRTVAGLGGADAYWTSYGYDLVGNRTSATQHALGSGGGALSSAYTYPAAGQARAHAVQAVQTKDASGTVVGTSTFDYDAAGNVTGRNLAGQPAQSLEWDAEGELTSVATDGETEADEYLYSADGDRLIRTQDGEATLYLPGGMELTAYDDGRANLGSRYYQFGGKTVAMRAGQGLSSGQVTVIGDHHDTPVIQVTQANNTATREYTDPFGATRGAAVGDADADGRIDGTWKGDKGYLGKTEDATGLTAIGARSYDPVLGRFISVDPIMDLSDPQQWNAYAYSNNNPTTWTDPTGMRPEAGNGFRDDYKHIQASIKHMKKKRSSKPRPPVAPPPYYPPTTPCTSYCDSDLESAAKGAGTAAAVAAPGAPGVAAAGVAKEVKRQALNLRSGKTAQIRSVGGKSQAALRHSVGWREFAAAGRTGGAKALGPIGAVAGGAISAKIYWDQNEQIVGMDTAEKRELTAVQTGIDVGAGVAGGIAGAKLGALIGSFIAPGAGTLIGAAVGGIIGGIAGAALASGANNAIGRNARENAASGRRWWEL
ncbi:RHS repeat domain-containing protein [Myceligenerans xiligouense]|uniref:RHS repeat-associated protein n=1 Tax=Myceligenerans xiligouense TaxID=253184 RepID=A0A3N4YIW8_9MICO|nr:RHS repeat-associated core domain-containing protein [Myceligenerans xiligouense]RPF20713.1 RHS repeat-associated protein [Myceligenerans xiligouense]